MNQPPVLGTEPTELELEAEPCYPAAAASDSNQQREELYSTRRPEDQAELRMI